MNLKTKYEEKRNEEKNGVELYFESIPTPEEREELKKNGFRWSSYNKCWYRSNTLKDLAKKEEFTLTSFKELTEEEKREIAQELWKDVKMQDYLLKTYDFYKTQDGFIIELEKVNKITIDKTMYYDDETEAPTVNETNFIIYNRHNVPGRNLEEYLKEKQYLQDNGCASGRYDYQGIYFVSHYYNNETVVNCNWYDEKDSKYFKRYLTIEEQEDYIKLMNNRKEQYIERLKKYFKKYGNKVYTYGYWANR